MFTWPGVPEGAFTFSHLDELRWLTACFCVYTLLILFCWPVPVTTYRKYSTLRGAFTQHISIPAQFTVVGQSSKNELYVLRPRVITSSNNNKIRVRQGR